MEEARPPEVEVAQEEDEKAKTRTENA